MSGSLFSSMWSIATSPAAFAGFVADDDERLSVPALLAALSAVAYGLAMSLMPGPAVSLSMLVGLVIGNVVATFVAGGFMLLIAWIFGAKDARYSNGFRLAAAMGWVASFVALPQALVARLGSWVPVLIAFAGLLWCIYLTTRALLELGTNETATRVVGIGLGVLTACVAAFVMFTQVAMGERAELRAAKLSRPQPTVAPTHPGQSTTAAGAEEPTPSEPEAAAPEPASGRLEPTGRMLTPRREHTATLLADGRVLVVGGSVGDFETVAAAETWTPRLGQWSAAGTLTEARVGHAATLLSDGRVLVTGGHAFASAGGRRERKALASAEVFDPNAGTWRTVSPMLEGRTSHSATLLADGRVLIVGGYGRGQLGEGRTQLWDPREDRWEWGPSLALARAQHVAFRLVDGSVLVAGGRIRSSDSPFPDAYLAEAEVLRPQEGRFFPTGWLTQIQPRFAGVLDAKGRAILVGSSTAEVWDEGSGRWAATAKLPRERKGDIHPVVIPTGAAAALADGRVVHAGGFEAAAVPDIDVLDPASLRWTPAASMKRPRIGHSATTLADGRVLLAGGAYSQGDLLPVTGEAELFIPDPVKSAALAAPSTPPTPQSRWRSASPLRHERLSHTVTALEDGSVLVVGGSRDAEAGATKLPSEILSLDAEPREAPAPGTARMHHAAARLRDGRVMIVGGERRKLGPSLASVEIFDHKMKRWRPAKSLSSGRTGHTVTVLADGSVLVVGGLAGPGGLVAEAELWSPHDGRWRPAGTLLQGRHLHTATLLPDGRVLVAGGTGKGVDGTSVEFWDPRRKAFTAAPRLAEARHGHAAVLLASGQVLVAGGAGSGRSSAEVYDVENGMWTRVGALAFPHAGHALYGLPDGGVLLVGGELPSMSRGSAAAERFDPKTARWTLVPNLQVGHAGPSCITAIGAVVVVAGESDLFGAPPSSAVEAWVP